MSFADLGFFRTSMFTLLVSSVSMYGEAEFPSRPNWTQGHQAVVFIFHFAIFSVSYPSGRCSRWNDIPDPDVVIFAWVSFPVSSPTYPTVGFSLAHMRVGCISPQILFFLTDKTTIASQLVSTHWHCLSPICSLQTSRSDALGIGHISAWPISFG